MVVIGHFYVTAKLQRLLALKLKATKINYFVEEYAAKIANSESPAVEPGITFFNSNFIPVLLSAVEQCMQDIPSKSSVPNSCKTGGNS